MTRIAPLLLLALFFGGCSKPTQPLPPVPDIPSSALEAREGIGRLFFQATDTGTAYVYDASTTEVVLVQPLQKDERLVFDPALNNATVEGKVVMSKPVNDAHIHRVYFLPGGATTAPATRP